MTNVDKDWRSEARFRLAMMYADQQRRYADAAVLLRQILDEDPQVARVRLELARMQAALGHREAAERELRAAEAAGLPPEAERMIRFFRTALNSRRPYGVNVEVALAPDSNINRATRSDTLETIIGDFDLNEDARETSGVGLTLRGQSWWRTPIDRRANLMIRAGGSGRFYRKSEFDDYALTVQAGPQYQSGADRIDIAAATSWRWYGQKPYSFTYGVTGNFTHPMGRKTQLTLDGAILHTDDRLNSLRDADRFSLSVGGDRAFSARFGGGVRVSGYRELAPDPGYSTASGGVSGYVFREIAQTTAVARIGYDRLESDARLFLYPRRRVDDRFEASLSGTFRALSVGKLAPIASVRYERNISTIEIYDYRRIALEFGITAAS